MTAMKVHYQFPSTHNHINPNSRMLCVADLAGRRGVPKALKIRTPELKLDLNGGELAESFDGGYLTGETVSLPTPTRDGYTFDGWHTSKNYTTKVSSSYVTNKDGVVTHYARWIAN